MTKFVSIHNLRHCSRSVLLLVLMLLGRIGILAQEGNQPLNYAGRDFWITAHSSHEGEPTLLYISGKANANITLTVNPTNNVQTYTHTGGTVTQIMLDAAQTKAFANNLMSPTVEIPYTRSIHITSDTDISVQLYFVAGFNDDGSLIFPSDGQAYGNEYYLIGPKLIGGTGNNVVPNASFSIVCRSNNTVLEITPSIATFMGKPAGVPFQVTLNKGDTYTIAPDNSIGLPDISGTKIDVLSSDDCNPINVFLTYNGGYMMWPLPRPGTVTTCCADQMYEQILPVSAWDTSYVVAPFRNNPYVVMKIVSAENNNEVRFNGIPVDTLQAGQYLDTMIQDAMVITANHPVGLVQNMISQFETASPGPPPPLDSLSDPASLFLLPVRDGVRDAYIRPVVNLPTTYPNPVLFIDPAYMMSAITIFSETSNVPAILLNNVSIAGQFAPVGGSGYSMARILLDTSKIYHLTSPQRVSVYYYGAYFTGSSAAIVGDVTPAPLILPVTDILRFCGSNSVSLQADIASRYLWSDGSTSRNITVSDTGLYYVQMFTSMGCGYSSAIKYFRVIRDSLSTSATADTFVKCMKETVLLQAQPADAYLWHDGSTAQTYTAAAFGDYYFVDEYHGTECHLNRHHFTILKDTTISASQFRLGNDTVLCNGDMIRLETIYRQTLWSDGHIGRDLIVIAPGTYWAQVYDTCQDATYADTISVTHTTCMKDFCNIGFPTAFSPNGDGRNDVFRPVVYGEFTGYFMAVYDRWGERVFQSYRKDEGWDGTYKGTPAESGVYYYMCNYECTKLGNKVIKGDVTLVR